MAQESGSHQPPDPVKQEIAHSRDHLSRDVRGLRYELDFPGKLRRSFRNQTTIWIATAVVLGAIVVSLPRGGKKVYIDVAGGGKKKKKILETGFLLGALRVGVTLLKPTLMSYVKSRMNGGPAAGRTRPGRSW